MTTTERIARILASVMDSDYEWDELADRWKDDYRAAARAVLDALTPSDLPMPAGVSDEEDW